MEAGNGDSRRDAHPDNGGGDVDQESRFRGGYGKAQLADRGGKKHHQRVGGAEKAVDFDQLLFGRYLGDERVDRRRLHACARGTHKQDSEEKPNALKAQQKKDGENQRGKRNDAVGKHNQLFAVKAVDPRRQTGK